MTLPERSHVWLRLTDAQRHLLEPFWVPPVGAGRTTALLVRLLCRFGTLVERVRGLLGALLRIVLSRLDVEAWVGSSTTPS
jgi:hypothetical protein